MYDADSVIAIHHYYWTVHTIPTQHTHTRTHAHYIAWLVLSVPNLNLDA